MNTPLLKRNRTAHSPDSISNRDEDDDGFYPYPNPLQPGHFSSLEKLMFFVSSVLFILLFIFVGLYARSSTGHIPPDLTPPKQPIKKPVCLESSCIKTAANILQNIDSALSPCDDFYAYTCNKWMDSHMIPTTQEVVNLPTMTTQSIRYRLHQILTSYKISELPSPDEVLNSQLFNKLTGFYESCLNNEPDIRSLYPMFRKIQQGGQVVNYLAERGVWAWFEAKTGPDMLRDPSRPLVYLSSPPEIQVDKERYIQGITKILKLVFDQDTEFGWNSWSPLATARRIVEFENDWPTEESPWLEKTVEEMRAEVPEIDWAFFMATRKRNFLIQKNVLEKLKRNASVRGRTMEMYLVWRTLWTYLDTMGDAFTERKRWLLGQGASPERWETCLTLLDTSYLGPLLGRYFVLDKEFEPAIQQVREETERLVDRLAKRMQNPEKVEKLRGMQFEFGYATQAQLNIMNVLSLAEYYGELQVDRKNLFENLLNTHRQAFSQGRREREQNSIKPPVFNPTSTQVIYRYEYNQVIVPAGLLQFPYFDVKGPDYLYQGTLGWMIGQAVMHGFDQIGRRYNQKGLLGDWWDKDPSQSCLISQYNAFGVDGDQTLNNNFADNGALMYNSSTNTTIPGLGQWTREQLFYIQFARMKCSKTTEQYKWTDTPPDRYRVNVPLMNSKHFSNVFKCNSGSYMNPRQKCEVW